MVQPATKRIAKYLATQERSSLLRRFFVLFLQCHLTLPSTFKQLDGLSTPTLLKGKRKRQRPQLQLPGPHSGLTGWFNIWIHMVLILKCAHHCYTRQFGSIIHYHVQMNANNHCFFQCQRHEYFTSCTPHLPRLNLSMVSPVQRSEAVRTQIRGVQFPSLMPELERRSSLRSQTGICKLLILLNITIWLPSLSSTLHEYRSSSVRWTWTGHQSTCNHWKLDEGSINWSTRDLLSLSFWAKHYTNTAHQNEGWETLMNVGLRCLRLPSAFAMGCQLQ